MVGRSTVNERTKEFYQQRQEATNTQNSPDEIRANHVGWNSTESQLHGFEAATNLSWINWSEVNSLLDVGCGYGNLSEFSIQKRQYQGTYLGIDIVPEFIDKARKLYDRQSGTRFLVGNFLELDWNQQKFDLVISLGGLSVNQDYPDPCGLKSLEYAQKFIELTARLAIAGISLYFPNADHIDPANRKPRMAYHQPSEIESIVRRACGSRCQDITFLSFPSPDNVKTVAQIQL
ncbi:class I SAM-dependent methyltransferase [Roseofilum casamattae]|uniref:Class I SAM-dependent methyltransferase n=1 Tax=Roseofilum casamattae BLCC-M143 TaxID=3022442 RepID=A0ABT7C232_9CYAN|nr:class I SAM-dependent methyltransferase [Roseofilum casamattae]MDJ1185517.1 class I SAM-dependent methyltransferase [Roseofilum casamattae BLCC-M143]